MAKILYVTEKPLLVMTLLCIKLTVISILLLAPALQQVESRC